MPDQYKNPEKKPCSGSYTWVPDTPIKVFGGVNPTVGFQNLIIDRGAFRNYYLRPNVKPPQTSAPTVSTKNDTEGDLYDPIINSTRPLAVNGATRLSNNQSLVVKATTSGGNTNSDGYEDFLQFDFPTNDTTRRLSCVKIEYDLSFYFGDELFNESNFNLNPTQSRALGQLKNGNLNAASAFISGLTPPVMRLYGVDNSGKDVLIGDVSITRARSEAEESNLINASGSEEKFVFKIENVKTANEILDRNKFPQYKSVKFKIRSSFSISSVTLILKKIAFFTADRVNFRTLNNTKQLPCAALGYSMFINGKFYPGLAYASILASAGGALTGSGGVDGTGAFTWPQDNRLNGCNIHVKLFSPDFITGSPGFAHSMNLHLIVFSFPAFGPFAEFLLPGVLFPHFAVILGPYPFNQQLIFYGNSNFKAEKANLAVMNSSGFRQNAKNVILAENRRPTNNIKSVFSYPDGIKNAAQNQFYYEVTGIGTSFQNIFISESGVQTFSGGYLGTLPRNNTDFLEAPLTPTPDKRTTRRDFQYNTYIFQKDASIYDLFTKSNPFLIFKCSNPDGYSGLFQQPGFITASIDGFVKDPAKLFNTQIVYRIYAVPKDSTDINPNNDFSLNHCLKIINSGQEDSTIQFTGFDSSWDFSNTLTSGNIADILQEIFVAEIINSEQRSFSVASQNFDLYCAIYAMSSLVDDQYEFYDISKLNSFDLPLITVSIKNNFTLTLPIFYKKSFKSGGQIQAQRDFGATGEYLKDESTYVVVNQFYDGRDFDNKQIYTNKLSSSSGYSFLLKMVNNQDISPEKTKIILETNLDQNAEVDFIVDFDSLSYAKNSTGSWKLRLVSEDLKELQFKYDVFLVDEKRYTFQLNLINSAYQEASEDGEITVDIKVPFYLPSGGSKAILRLYIAKSKRDEINEITFEKIELLENTIEYFQFKNRLPNSAPFGFYEDLPIQPPTLGQGCSEFILKLDIDQSQVGIMYDPLQGLSINGCLYSPTWIVDLPKNMELDYRGVINDSLLPRATGVRPYQIFFRTGLPNKIISVDTKRHGSTGLVMTTYNLETNQEDFAVRQIVSEGVSRNSSFSNFVTTPNAQKSLVNLNVQNPILTRSNQMVVGGQNSSNEIVSTAALGVEAPGFTANLLVTDGVWKPYTNNETDQRISGCLFTVQAYDPSQIYIAGVTPEGGLLFNQQPLYVVSGKTQSLLIEGKPNITQPELDLLGAIGISTGEFKGPVSMSYPGLISQTQGCIVFYTYSSKASSSVKQKSCIYAIFLGRAALPTAPEEVFDFKKYCEEFGNTQNFPEILNITVCNHDIYPRGNESYIAFTCSGKIFVIKLIYQVSLNFTMYRVTSVAIVYGNLIKPAGGGADSEFIDIINSAIGASKIFRFKAFNYDKDLESSQRVGFVDYDGLNLGVQYKDNNNIMELVFDKSYSVPGQLRKISLN